MNVANDDAPSGWWFRPFILSLSVGMVVIVHWYILK